MLHLSTCRDHLSRIMGVRSLGDSKAAKDEPRPGDGAQAIRRALLVVRSVAQLQRTGATLARIRQAAGLPRSTTFRILRALVDEGMLRFHERDRTYHIGTLAFELGLAADGHAEVQARWRAVVEDVALRTGLTSYLMAGSHDEAVCLFCAQGAAAIRAMPFETGQRVPLGIGAGGLAILASRDDAEVGRIVAMHQQRLRLFPSGALKTEQLLARVAATRARGYSVSTGTVAKGVSGVGVLVTDPQRSMQLAITVSAVTDRLSAQEAERLAALIKASAGRVSGIG